MTKNIEGGPPFKMDRFNFFRRNTGEEFVLPIVVRNPRMMPFCFILGAQDPEMDEIEKLLVENGEAFKYAEYEGGRVAPWNSYIADSIMIPPETVTVLVECEPIMFEGNDAIIRIIDHHRPGDDGHNAPASKFWEASSIGQTYKLLNTRRSEKEQLVPTQEHVRLAAMDHCAAQARLGKCPGIDPEDVRDLSLRYTSERTGKSILEIEVMVNTMQDRILASPTVLIGAQEVFDLTSISVGLSYDFAFLCMQEAVIDLGQVALLRTRNRLDGPDKFIICGAATPDTVRYFMKSWAPSRGLKYIYGVPARGYAGAYRE